jgi:hypothetical protein
VVLVEPITWHAKAWKDIEDNMDVRQGDSEHVIEAQTIAGFPEDYLPKHGLSNTCSVTSVNDQQYSLGANFKNIETGTRARSTQCISLSSIAREFMRPWAISKASFQDHFIRTPFVPIITCPVVYNLASVL